MIIGIMVAAAFLAVWVPFGVAAFRQGRASSINGVVTSVLPRRKCVIYALLGPIGWIRSGRGKHVEHWLAEA